MPLPRAAARSGLQGSAWVQGPVPRSSGGCLLPVIAQLGGRLSGSVRARRPGRPAPARPLPGGAKTRAMLCRAAGGQRAHPQVWVAHVRQAGGGERARGGRTQHRVPAWAGQACGRLPAHTQRLAQPAQHHACMPSSTPRCAAPARSAGRHRQDAPCGAGQRLGRHVLCQDLHRGDGGALRAHPRVPPQLLCVRPLARAQEGGGAARAAPAGPCSLRRVVARCTPRPACPAQLSPRFALPSHQVQPLHCPAPRSYTPLLPAMCAGTVEERSIVEAVRAVMGNKVRRGGPPLPASSLFASPAPLSRSMGRHVRVPPLPHTTRQAEQRAARLWRAPLPLRSRQPSCGPHCSTCPPHPADPALPHRTAHAAAHPRLTRPPARPPALLPACRASSLRRR